VSCRDHGDDPDSASDPVVTLTSACDPVISIAAFHLDRLSVICAGDPASAIFGCDRVNETGDFDPVNADHDVFYDLCW